MARKKRHLLISKITVLLVVLLVIACNCLTLHVLCRISYFFSKHNCYFFFFIILKMLTNIFVSKIACILDVFSNNDVIKIGQFQHFMNSC